MQVLPATVKDKMARCIEFDLVRDEIRRIVSLVYHLGCAMKDQDLPDATRSEIMKGIISRLGSDNVIDVICVGRTAADWPVEIRQYGGCRFHPTSPRIVEQGQGDMVSPMMDVTSEITEVDKLFHRLDVSSIGQLLDPIPVQQIEPKDDVKPEMKELDFSEFETLEITSDPCILKELDLSPGAIANLNKASPVVLKVGVIKKDELKLINQPQVDSPLMDSYGGARPKITSTASIPPPVMPWLKAPSVGVQSACVVESVIAVAASAPPKLSRFKPFDTVKRKNPRALQPGRKQLYPRVVNLFKNPQNPVRCRSLKLDYVEVNELMPATERNLWSEWGQLPFHPLRLPGCDKSTDETYLTLSAWPIMIVRPSNGLRLFHACRMHNQIMLCDLFPLKIWNLEETEVKTAWVPRSCGPDSEFRQLLLSNHVNRSELATACGFPEPFAMSYGVGRFFLKMALGQVMYHKLYIGECPGCGFWLNHWDTKETHQCGKVGSPN